MKEDRDKFNAGRRHHLFLLLSLVLLLLLTLFQRDVVSQEKPLDWGHIAKFKPELKVLVMIEGGRPISLEGLAALAELGIVPADRDPALLIGLERAIFSTSLKKWMTKPSLPNHMEGKLLDRFIMSGIYRVGFRVEKEGYLGPLSFEITAPRNSFGKELLFLETLVRPQNPSKTYSDFGGNRWLLVDYPEVKDGQTIKFYFAFRYQVDMAALLDHDLVLADQHQDAPLPEEIHPFLDSGDKIDARSPEAIAWAREGGSKSPNVRLEYQRLRKFIKDTIAYDSKKRDQYFGGKAVYSDPDQMYQAVWTL